MNPASTVREPTTLAAIWDDAVSRQTDSPFLLFVDDDGIDHAWTYGEFDVVVRRCARAMTDRGISAGGVVHVALKNCPAFVAIWLAVAHLRACLVPVDPQSTPRQLRAQLRRFRPDIGIYGAQRRTEYLDAARESGVAVLELSETSADLEDQAFLGNWSHQDNERVAETPQPTERLAVLLTSGTTAEPKGVVLTQANYAYAGRVMAELAELNPQDRYFVSLPLFHANAQYYCFAAAIAVGASVALASRFSASQWIEQARTVNATHASLFAAPIRMILSRTAADAEPARLRHVWFAQTLGSDHYDRFASLAGCRPRQLYGMTETLAAVTCNSREQPRPDRIGLPVPGRAIGLIGTDKYPGDPTVGVLRVYGTPGVELFSEYLHDPPRTAEVLVDDGTGGAWFTTGDIVRAHPDSTLEFVGRVDDVIKISGENVSLTEVEAVLSQAPGVMEVAVIAIPDSVRDIVPSAYVVARPATALEVDELIEWSLHNMPPAWRPHHWHIVDDLPKTSVGKIQRYSLQPNADLIPGAPNS